MSDVDCLKNKHRKLIKEQLSNNSYSGSYVDDLLLNNFQNLWVNSFNDLSIKIVAAYYPKKTEANTLKIIEWLRGLNYCIALPKVQNESKVLNFIKWNGGSLIKSNLDICEPAEGDIVTPNVIILPLLGFDNSGSRLGYGGGYYDATLNYLQKQQTIIKIGLAFGFQEFSYIPQNEFDVKLDAVVTEKKYKLI